MILGSRKQGTLIDNCINIYHLEIFNSLWRHLLIFLLQGDRFVCRSPTCRRNGHLHRVTYTRGCIDTTDSPDDEHGVARNMKRIEINR